ncbi:MAG: DUF58 domain-containing protein [Clostridia bacterium]|nr:DUF58 domain-containing protein [Clostridia bacterium]MBR0406801.1 DUF58 domain-containing protein [Clostridia bacterium]
MTRRGGAALAMLVTSAVSALSLGNAMYLYICLLLLLAFIYAFATCLWARLSAECSQRLSSKSVFRGERVFLSVRAFHRCPLPVSAMQGVFLYNGQETDCLFPARPYRSQERRLPLEARHVGVYPAGLARLTVSDLFGFFRFRVPVSDGASALTVLPRPFDIEKPRMVLGDDGSAVLARTQEDYNVPEDVRAYRTGDAMKRIHWKLSSRKRELLVRRFETPAPPDTLILLDCENPLGGENVNDGKACLRDAMCETAVAVARMQMEDGSPVRLPLYGERANEFSSDRAGELTILQEMLAGQPFGGGEDFARVLHLELRRMRTTGAAVIITTRLDAQVVEGVTHIRRMGPSARLYLVTYTPEAPEYQPFVAHLQHHLVEVCYVTPA